MTAFESLPVELSELVDELADRLAQGNRGSEDDAISRSLAETCVRTIISCGFEIRQVGEMSQKSVKEANQVVEELHKSGRLRLKDLLHIWRRFSDEESVGPAELYAQIGERVLKAGEPLLAYDILKVGLNHWSKDIRLRQLLALALARSGAPSRAASWLRELVSEGHADEETLGLLARTYKDLWDAEIDPSKKNEYLREAHRLYREGYDRAVVRQSPDGALYTGINAATTALLLNETETATSLAHHVAEICTSKPNVDSDYWALATLGECALIAGQFDEATDRFGKAVELAGHNYADIASTRRNAAILLRHLEIDPHVLAEWFPIPSVALFSGHLIDRVGMPTRFPPSQINAVQTELRNILDEAGVGFGYSSAACGGDLLFLEVLQQRGGESRIVLPLGPDQFIKSSVAIDTGRDWLPDFNTALDYATHVTVVNDFSQSADPLHFEYANCVMTGLAILHAQTLGTKITPVALWDEEPARGPGGTGSIVELWKKLGLEPRIINPLGTSSGTRVEQEHQGASQNGLAKSVVEKDFEQDVCAILFADVVGYSKITEEEIPLFVREFMESIARSVRESGVKLEASNTWGDAIYFVFRNVEEAGLTALRVTELVNSIDWESRGFRQQLNLRIGLHVGPVFRFIDPVTQVSTRTGAHVSRAARIEPITPAGEVYASEAFAAVAAAEKVTGFQCDYVGVTPMAKGYGEFPTYHVRRASY